MAQNPNTFGFQTNASGSGGGGTTYTAGDGLTLTGTEFDLDAVITTITSIKNTSLVIGRDADNEIDFSTDNELVFRVSGVDEFRMSSNSFAPFSDNGAALGSTTKEWSDLFLNSGGVINFNTSNAIITNDANGSLLITTSNPSVGTRITHRRFTPSTNTLGNVGDADVVNFGSGSVTIGKVYYLTSAGAWALADRRTTAPSIGFMAVAMGTGVASSVGMVIRGTITTASTTTSVGAVLYLRINGDLDESIPTASGEYVRIMGYVLGTSGEVYFNPSQDWTQLA